MLFGIFNGITELIIIQMDETSLNAMLTVYTYDNSAYKIGDYSNIEKSFKSVLRFSNNPMFPGLFDFCWGGGVEHYTYLTIKEGKLSSEYLWNEDRTIEPPQKNEFSDDEQLIKESINVYMNWDSPDNLIDMYLINDDNIKKLKDLITHDNPS